MYVLQISCKGALMAVNNTFMVSKIRSFQVSAEIDLKRLYRENLSSLKLI